MQSATLEQAKFLLHVKEFKEAELRADKRVANIAAREMCRCIGLFDLMKGISETGEMNPPPVWPEADIVPVGGGPGYVLALVRTRYKTVPIIEKQRIERAYGKRVGSDPIGEAKERGLFAIRKRIREMG